MILFYIYTFDEFEMACILSFVCFLVIHPQLDIPARQQLIGEADKFFKSVVLSNPGACKYILTDQWGARNLFPPTLFSETKVLPLVDIPREAYDDPHSLRDFLNVHCPFSRMRAFARFLKEHSAGDVVISDTDVLVLSDIRHIFRAGDFDIAVPTRQKRLSKGRHKFPQEARGVRLHDKVLYPGADQWTLFGGVLY